MFFASRIGNNLKVSRQECMATNSANPDLFFQPEAQMPDPAEKDPIEPSPCLLNRIFYHSEFAVRLFLLISFESEKAPPRLQHV
jgi:hypothetical protein